jgi:hypothetical protein
VVLLWGMDLASWSLAMNERGEHQDLRGSGRRNIIPYAQERTGFYCSSLPCLCEPEPFFDRPTPVKWCLLEPFIAQGRVVTMSFKAR